TCAALGCLGDALQRPNGLRRWEVPCLHAHPLRPWIVEGRQRGVGGEAFTRDFDFVPRGQYVRSALPLAGNIAEADGAAEMVAIIAAGDGADDLAVAHDGFIVEKQRFGVTKPELDEPA